MTSKFPMQDSEILSNKTLLSSKYFTVKRKTIKRKGKKITKDFIQKNPRVVIIPYTEKKEIYIESQYRDALENTLLELVAGNLEEGEDELETAKRELLEETGLTAKSWKKLCVWELSANLQSKIHVFVATDITEGKQHLDVDEDITVIKLPLKEIIKKIENQEIIVAYQIAAILLFDRMLREGKL